MSWMRGGKGTPVLIGFLILVILVLVGVIAHQASKSSTAVVAPTQVAQLIATTTMPTPVQTTTLVPNNTPKPTHSVTSTSVPTHRSTAKPTKTLHPTVTPTAVSPAQQLAAKQLGHPTNRKNKVVVGFVKDLRTLQKYCGGYQFQIVPQAESLWKKIHFLGRPDTLAQVTHGLAELATLDRGDARFFVDCPTEAGLYLDLRRDNKSMKTLYIQASYTPTPAPSDTPIPTDTPYPTVIIASDSYLMVADHPDLYLNDEVNWQCAVAKFLGPNENGESQVGCWEFTGVYDGSTGDGEVILTVPNRIDTDSILTGDMLLVDGTVDDPISGTNAYGATLTWPQLDVVDITDEGPLGN